MTLQEFFDRFKNHEFMYVLGEKCFVSEVQVNKYEGSLTLTVTFLEREPELIKGHVEVKGEEIEIPLKKEFNWGIVTVNNLENIQPCS